MNAAQPELRFVPAPGTTVWWKAGPLFDSRMIRGRVVTIAEWERATGTPWWHGWSDSLPVFTDQDSERANQWRCILISALTWD